MKPVLRLASASLVISGALFAPRSLAAPDSQLGVEVEVEGEGARLAEDAVDAVDVLTGKGRPTGWHPDHPVAVGTRTAAWVGAYGAPSVGGHVKIRPVEWIGVEAFSDNFIWVQGDSLRRDHIIGFSIYAPSLLGDEKRFIAPMLGTSLDFRFANDLDVQDSNGDDVLFGAHVGLMAEVFVFKGLSLELTGQVAGYMGQHTDLGHWNDHSDSALAFATVGQATASANYYF
jgi:hypothetical protein